MGLCQDLEQFKNASPERKISVLRGEMIPLLVTIKTYTKSIRYLEGDAQAIELWTGKILDAVSDLECLRQMLIDAPNP